MGTVRQLATGHGARRQDRSFPPAASSGAT